MNIIFLDFDGVLNSSRWNRVGGSFRDELDTKAVERINKILRAVPNTKIVISSSWKKNLRLNQLKDFLKRWGFEGEVIGITPGAQTQTESGIILANGRGEEITAWLRMYDDNRMAEDEEIESFIVIDDEAYGMGPVLDRLVKTTFESGLLDYHVDYAIQLLENYTYSGPDNLGEKYGKPS